MAYPISKVTICRQSAIREGLTPWNNDECRSTLGPVETRENRDARGNSRNGGDSSRRLSAGKPHGLTHGRKCATWNTREIPGLVLPPKNQPKAG
jgi:hypothetical protein